LLQYVRGVRSKNFPVGDLSMTASFIYLALLQLLLAMKLIPKYAALAFVGIKE
jgi:hypothetical protein